jgi:hypothetical protein
LHGARRLGAMHYTMDQIGGHIFRRQRSPNVATKLLAKFFSRLLCLPSETLSAKLFISCFIFSISFLALFLLAVLFLYR